MTLKKLLTVILSFVAVLCVFSAAACDDEVATQYTLTYELDGGTLSEDAIKAYIELDVPIELPTPTKTGYEFLGWREGEGDIIKSLPANAKGDKTLTAVWQAKSYTITFEYGEYGSGIELTRTVRFDEVIVGLPVPTNITAGKKFAGWKTEDGAPFSNGGAYKIDGNVTLTAEYIDAVYYTIEYQLEGGSWNTTAITSYEESDQPITLPTPIKENNAFVGWRVVGGGDETITALPAHTTGNKTLFAVWQPAYVITFNNTSSDLSITGWADNTTEFKVVIAAYGETVTPPQIKYDTFTPTEQQNSPYYVEGWYYIDNNSNQVLVDFTKPFNVENINNVTGYNITLYVSVAVGWTPNY